MIFANRRYTAEDYGACRWIWEVRSVRMRANVTTLGPLTPTIASRLALLNLVDGDNHNLADGDTVRLTGLGVKTAKEAQRLDVAAITAGGFAGGQSRPNPTQQQQQDDCPK